MKKVLIIQRSLFHYRADFYNGLREKLADNGVELNLAYGKLKNKDALKQDEVDLEWATYVENKVFKVGGIELYWQPCLSFLDDQDLVIVEQANKNLINYVLVLRRALTKLKLGYWGHGRNMQRNENDWGNRFKRYFINKCDWWFAYTEGVKRIIVSQSFPPANVTVVQNAIDTRSLVECYDSLTKESLSQLRAELGIASNNVAIYCGGIYKEKRIDFLIEACDQVRQQVNDFHILIVGSGPDVNLIHEARATRDWVHYIGPKFGLERVKYFQLASLFLMPGLVGLAVLDSFALRTPMITTQYPYHSPEVEYLKNGVNGLMTEDNPESYVAAVVGFFQNDTQRIRLTQGCRDSASKYTVEKMVDNFANGILKCLRAENYPRKETFQDANASRVGS
ncbi:MAG: glycosyltransferase family 4 protein [Ferruginibacter sp.]|nr:glycosyltransferase family 4 protein [Cytophagales bacterium]